MSFSHVYCSYLVSLQSSGKCKVFACLSASFLQVSSCHPNVNMKQYFNFRLKSSWHWSMEKNLHNKQEQTQIIQLTKEYVLGLNAFITRNVLEWCLNIGKTSNPLFRKSIPRNLDIPKFKHECTKNFPSFMALSLKWNAYWNKDNPLALSV